MAMIDVNDSSLQADSQLKSVCVVSAMVGAGALKMPEWKIQQR